MRWAPRIVVIAPGIRARFDGLEPVTSFSIGHYAPAAIEMRIERRVRLIVPMPVTSTGIGLPNFQQGIGNRLPILIDYAATHNDPRTDRLTRVCKSHIVIALGNCILAEDRAGDFRKRVREKYESLRGRALHRRFIRRIKIRRLRPGFRPPVFARFKKVPRCHGESWTAPDSLVLPIDGDNAAFLCGFALISRSVGRRQCVFFRLLQTPQKSKPERLKPVLRKASASTEFRPWPRSVLLGYFFLIGTR